MVSTPAPLLLALESATAWLGVALFRGVEPIARWRERAPGASSDALVPAVVALLHRCGVAPGEVEQFAVSVGPGSFTGLRVAVATAKGLAFGEGPVVAPVPTLEALARGVRAAGAGEAQVVAVLDARRGELYAAAYGLDGTERLAPSLLRPASLAARLPCVSTCLAGDAVEVAADALRARLGGALRCCPPPVGAPDPVAVGRLGVEILRRGEGVRPEALHPHYLRRAEAEVRRAAAGGSGSSGRG